MRVHKVALDNAVGQRVPINHSCIPWLVQHSADLVNSCIVVFIVSAHKKPDAAPGPVNGMKQTADALGLKMQLADHGRFFFTGPLIIGKWYVLEGDTRQWKIELKRLVQKSHPLPTCGESQHH